MTPWRSTRPASQPSGNPASASSGCSRSTRTPPLSTSTTWLSTSTGTDTKNRPGFSPSSPATKPLGFDDPPAGRAVVPGQDHQHQRRLGETVIYLVGPLAKPISTPQISDDDRPPVQPCPASQRDRHRRPRSRRVPAGPDLQRH